MTYKHAFYTVSKLFKDFCRKIEPFDDKVIIVSGDFRKTLLIVCHGSRVQIIESCVKRCKISSQFHSLNLQKRRSQPQRSGISQGFKELHPW